MGVLSFDGSGDQLKWTSVTAALRDVSDGAWTMAALCKFSDFTHFNALSYLLSGAGAGTAEVGLSFTSSSNIMYIDDGASGYNFVSLINNTANPYLFVVSKGAGAAIPRLSWKLGVAGSWTDENSSSGSMADQIDSVQLQIGTWQDADSMEGWIGVIGWWEGAMSDTDKHALDDNWQTSDWWNNAHGQPLFLAELNVAGASVVDLAGNASSLAVTGTTLDAGETLNSWNFNGTGSVDTGLAWIRA